MPKPKPRKGTQTAVGFIPAEPDRADIADARAEMANQRCLELEKRADHAYDHRRQLEARVSALERAAEPWECPEWIVATAKGLLLLAVCLAAVATFGAFIAFEVWAFKSGHYILGSIPLAAAVLATSYAIGDTL